jgi:hypothetical protein
MNRKDNCGSQRHTYKKADLLIITHVILYTPARARDFSLLRNVRTGCVAHSAGVRLRFKCDGMRAETRFRLSAKRTSPFKSKRTSVQSTTGS